MKLNKMQSILFLYVALIFVWALLYMVRGEQFTTPLNNYYEALYFSVVTITTLGYGDISPNTGITKFLAGTQTLYGILTFGLLMNATAVRMAQNSQSRQKDAAKKHLIKEYGYMRRQILNLIIDCANSRTKKDIHDACEHILTGDNQEEHLEFRKVFSGKDAIGSEVFYEFQNRLDDENSEVLKEVYLELEILSKSIDYLLNKVESDNRDAHDLLMRVSQSPIRYKNSYIYSENQGKYVGTLVFEIMASFSTVTGPYDYDYITHAIEEL